ncbi:MAG: hypothetical protein U0325_08270 [Polyangiales bacterium]
MSRAEPWAAGLALCTGDRLISPLDETPVGPRWRAEAPGGGLSDVLLVAPLRDDLPRDAAARVVDASAALQHPQLRPVRRAALDRGHAVWAYDPADGVGLAAWLAREATQGVTPLARVRELFDPVCQAIAVVHRGGALAHGGIAPWCVQVDARGRQVIARVDAVGAALLAPPLGVDRLAPELDPRAFTLSQRADVFALGMLLGTLLLGEEAPSARLPARLDEARPDLDASLRALIRTCLADDPEARPADAARLRDLARRAVWTPQAVSTPPPPRHAARPAASPSFERAPPSRPAPTPTPPAPSPSDPLDDRTEAVRAPPPSYVPDAPEPTAFVTALPDAAQPASAHAATLRTPRRAPREDQTRALVAPPPDESLEHTWHVYAPPPDEALAHTRHVYAPPPDATPAVVEGPADANNLPPSSDDDVWGGTRSSFHVISVPPAAPAWAPPPPPPAAPIAAAPPALAPLDAPSRSARGGAASLVVAALVVTVVLAAMLIAWTR